MNPTYSVSIPALKQYITAAQSLQVDTQSVLSSHCLETEVLTNNDARIPLSQFEALVTALIEASGHPYFGLYASNHINPTMYASLGLISISAATLRNCIDLVPTYETLVGDMGVTQLNEHENWISLSWHCRLQNPIARRHVSEAVLASWFLYGKNMLGLEGELQGLSFEHKAEMVSTKEYQAVFSCEPLFEQVETALLLDKSELDKALPQANPALQESLISHANQLLAKLAPGQKAGLDNVKGASEQNLELNDIHQQIILLLENNDISKARLASKLNISPRTLQRRFENLNTSYQDELSKVRLNIAKELLLQNVDSQRLCDQLGFSEPRSFFRRFKQWTGMTAGEFVKQHRSRNP